MMITQTLCTEERKAIEEAAAFPRTLTDRQQMVARMLAPTQSNGCPRPDRCMPTRELLDQFLSGELSDDAWYEVSGWAEWMSDFSDAMNWWESLWWCALEELKERDAESEMRSHLNKLTLLSGQAYAAYPMARQENFEDVMSGFTGELYTSTLELAKSYRLYTRYVESLVMEVWPGLNRELLLHPDSGFKKAAA
jgi:hypothetical protein